MLFEKFRYATKTIWRIISIQDNWSVASLWQKIKLVIIFLLNLTDTLSKIMGPLALAKSVEAVASSQPHTEILGNELTPEQLLYISATFNLIHFVMSDIRKILFADIQEQFSKKLSATIIIESQNRVINMADASLNQLLSETSKHLHSINFESEQLLINCLENIHPLILDITLGISFAFMRFEKSVGFMLCSYFFSSFIMNELLSHFTQISQRNQNIRLTFSSYVRRFHETLINANTMHLFNRNKLEQNNINHVHEEFANLRKTNHRYERLWVIQSLSISAIQFFATAYVAKDNFQSLELDDLIFLLNYIANLGNTINSMNYSLRAAISAIQSLEEANAFIKNSNQQLANVVITHTEMLTTEKTPLIKPKVIRRKTLKQRFMELISNPQTPITENPLNEIYLDTEHPIAIEFKNVSFYYREEEPILSTVSFKIPAGDKYAIVGSTNIGKSTIIKLICGLLRPTNPDAEIKIFGRNVNTLPTKQLLHLLSVSCQYIEIFEEDSVAYNILYGYLNDALLYTLKNPAAKGNNLDNKTSENYATIIRQACLTEIAQRQDCRGLSGGQRQRIGIARILARNSKIFIFDEPTSQLDSKTESKILCNIQHLTQGKTTLMIAHRLSTIKDAKKIFVIGKHMPSQHGATVMEEGTHEELLTQQQEYAELWRLQTQ